jgi:ATP-binding cassette subfamily B protein RaxB
VNAPLDMEMTFLPRRRVRAIRQAEAAECGLAALAMIANYWGHEFDLGALRRRFGVSSRGIGLKTLMETADALGFSPRPLKVRLDGLSAIQLPAILHWDMDHFVVLERVSKGKAYIVDPAQDGRWHDRESLSRHFTGVALELRPSRDFKPEAEKKPLRLSQLWGGAVGLKRSIAQAAVLSLVLQAYVLAAPYFLQLAVDEALPALDVHLMTVLAIGFGLFALVNAGAALLRSFVLLTSGTALAFGIASNIARRLIREAKRRRRPFPLPVRAPDPAPAHRKRRRRPHRRRAGAPHPCADAALFAAPDAHPPRLAPPLREFPLAHPGRRAPRGE